MTAIIQLNHREIKQYPISQIKDMITYIPQDCYLFEVCQAVRDSVL